ncbi:metal-dependent hydrolase [Rubricoccus marinus]|uniref:metal-dependent hydrolase n=1 Tax=Rubricoccus marinus TaxID=716817 RepID=UPI001FECC012|nr:metal-dependent hydrolase [Rubricoccus marinus]
MAATFFQVPWTATGVVVASAAAAAPDIDTLGSTVGRVFSPLARRIERRWGHRTITHCYAAQTAVAALALPFVWAGLPHIYAAIVVGYISHPFLDTWTVQGVRVFWPWSDRRGVFPYYNRQETSYRTTTGSRVDAFFGICFVCLTIPFAVLEHDGYQRFVRRVQADASAAVRDFLDWSAEGYLVQIEVEASDPQHMRLLEGTFEAIGTTGANTLLVRDTTDGRVFSLGPAYTANFQPSRVLAHRGAQVQVSRRQIDLAGRVLADLESLVPAGADGHPVRHLIDGQVTVTEAAGVTPDEFRFDTVTGTDKRLSFQFATLADLTRLDLTGLIVEQGTVTLRVYVRDGEAEDYDPQDMARSQVRRVTFAHKPSEPPQLLVREGQSVAVGDTVAVLTSSAMSTAQLDVAEAQADLAAAQATAPPVSADPVTLRQRLVQAEASVRRVEDRHAEGFEPQSAVDAARAEASDLRAQVAAAESAGARRTAEWQRTRAERIRQATARLRRATLRQQQAIRDGYVRSSGAGIVRRIETRDLGPDRTEVRIVLVSDRAGDSGTPSTSPPEP